MSVATGQYTITQKELNSVIRGRRTVSDLRKELKSAEEDLAYDERDLIEALQDGASVAVGLFTASVAGVVRRNISWKGVVVHHLGEAFAEEVTAKTLPTTTSTLVIE